jgi:hypothetical protein
MVECLQKRAGGIYGELKMNIAFLNSPAAVADRSKKPALNDYVLAGHLCAPGAAASAAAAIDCQDADPEVILSILRANKVPLVNLDRRRADVYPELLSSAAFKAQYALEFAECRQLKREWVRVRNEFTNAGIESMLIKSVGFFPYRSSNLDVLIKQDKRQRAQSILSELGYIQLHNVAEPYKMSGFYGHATAPLPKRSSWTFRHPQIAF